MAARVAAAIEWPAVGFATTAGNRSCWTVQGAAIGVPAAVVNASAAIRVSTFAALLTNNLKMLSVRIVTAVIQDSGCPAIDVADLKKTLTQAPSNAAAALEGAAKF